MIEAQKHVVLLLPGLGDQPTGWLVNILSQWWKYIIGVDLQYFSVNWRDKTESLKVKLDRLHQAVQTAQQTGAHVSLLGTSAGGSLAVAYFLQHADQIHRCITVCSRLTRGEQTGFRSFTSRTRKYPVFADSVRKSEELLQHASLDQRKMILSMFGVVDELVPRSTSFFEGTVPFLIPMLFHVPSITTALFSGVQKIAQFVKQGTV